MLGLCSVRPTEHGRPFWLLVALAVTLLAGVSTTMANASSALALIDGLRRDLGAVRAQLERADPAAADVGRRSVAFNAGLGDGGAAFRHRSMATILRGANRRLENLIAGYHKLGDQRRADIAEGAQLHLRALHRRLDYLGSATDAPSMMWARNRLEAENLLDRLHETLVILVRGPGVDADRPGPISADR